MGGLIPDPQEPIGPNQTKAKFSNKVSQGAEAGPLQYEMHIMKPGESSFTGLLKQGCLGRIPGPQIPPGKSTPSSWRTHFYWKVCRGRGPEDMW